MDELLSKLVGIVVILFSCESYQTIAVHVNFEWVETGDEHVDSQIIFKSIDQVRIRNVLACQHSFSLVDLRMRLDNFDSSATASCHGFEDPKGGRVALSLTLEKLVVF